MKSSVALVATLLDTGPMLLLGQSHSISSGHIFILRRKFLVVYHAPLSAAQQMADASPDQVRAGMGAWMTWAKKAGFSMAVFESIPMPGA